MSYASRTIILAAVFAATSWICAQVAGQPDTAAEYLRAWAYRDYALMAQLSSAKVRGLASKQEFLRAAAALPVPQAEARVVSRTEREGGVHVYFEYPGAGGTMRGSLVLRADGVEHPELVAALGSPAVAGGAGQLAGKAPADDGEVDEILRHMNEASVRIKGLRASVNMSGSFMGVSVNQSGTLLFQQPDRMLLRLPQFVAKGSGGRLVLYMAEANAVMDLGNMGGFELAPGIGGSPQDLRKRYGVRAGGRESFKGEPVRKLRLTPPQGLTAGLMPASDMVLWISEKTWLPVKAEMGSFSMEYLRIEVDPPDLTEASFAFTPPADATNLSLSSLMGSLGAGRNVPAD